MRLRSLLTAVTATTAAAFTAAPAAQAGLLVTSAPACTTGAPAQVFAPWSDPANYVFGPDGGFEAGGRDWTLGSGASVADVSEPFALHSTADSRSLALPAGSTATTPTICVGIAEPSVRFVARRTAGAASSRLLVTAQTETSLGLVLTLPIGVVSSTGAWAPSPPMLLLTNLLPLLPGSHTPIRLTFSAQGGTWQVDDLYVDPYKRG